MLWDLIQDGRLFDHADRTDRIEDCVERRAGLGCLFGCPRDSVRENPTWLSNTIPAILADAPTNADTMGTPTRILSGLLVSSVVVGTSLDAQPAPVPPSSSAVSTPHERLTFFEGLWTVEEVPASRELRERCAWMAGGRRHMVCQSRSKNAAGEWRDGLSMFSYRTSDSSYVYYGLRPSGSTQTLVGRITTDGDAWEFHGTEGSGATRIRTLVRIMRLPAGRFRFVEQSAAGDSAFASADTVHYRPARGLTGAP